MPSNENQRESSPEVMAARHEVEEKKRELENRLETVRRSSGNALKNFSRKARPVLFGVAVVAAVFVIVKIARSRSNHQKVRTVRYLPVQAPEPPSLPKIAVGEALRAAVRMVAARMAENAVLRLASGVEHDESERAPDENFSTAAAK